MESMEELSSNRRFQLSVAWSLWKRYINKEGDNYIDATNEEQAHIRQFLQQQDQKALYSLAFSAIKVRSDPALMNSIPGCN